MSHKCHALECEREVPPSLFACARHWWMVPKEIRAKIWRHYRPGQDEDKRPTQLYIYWAHRARAAIAEKEKQTNTPRYKTIKQSIESMEQEGYGEE